MVQCNSPLLCSLGSCYLEEEFSVASGTRVFLVCEIIDLVRIFRNAVHVSMIGISVIGMSIFCSAGTFGSCLCAALG